MWSVFPPRLAVCVECARQRPLVDKGGTAVSSITPDPDPTGPGRSDYSADPMGSGHGGQDPVGAGHADWSADPTAASRMRDGQQQLRLSKLLRELNTELQQTVADEQKAGQTPLLKVKECTAELDITWSLEGDGEVKFWVLDLTGKASRESAQKITVTLEPIHRIETLTGGSAP
jgi:hypothetical protein